MAGRVIGWIQVILQVCGLCGIVDEVTGLGDLAIRIIANYLIFSAWIMGRISEILNFSPPVYLFHYFLLGASFWTPITFGLHRMIGKVFRIRYVPAFVWYVLRVPTYQVVYAAASAPPGKSFAYVFFDRPSRERGEKFQAWRRFRRDEPWKWIKVSLAANFIRAMLISLIIFLFAFFIGIPLIFALLWPYFLFDALRAKFLHWRTARKKEPQNVAEKTEDLSPPDPYVEMRDHALDRFALVLFLFVLFAIVTSGIEKRGGLAAIIEDFKQRLEEALP